MKPIVIYVSRGGKTGKIANAIAEELGCDSSDVGRHKPDVSEADFLIVGSGTYGGKPDKRLLEFVSKLNPSKGARAAIFTTSAGPEPKSLPEMRRALAEKGYEVVSSFDCRGQFLIGNRGHPNDLDLKSAKTFADTLREA